jgi:hypothetical protein
LVFALIATLIIGLARWKKSSRWGMGPALLCIAFISSMMICRKIGVWVAVDDWQFKKQMADFVKTVDSIKSGDVPCSPSLTLIDIKNLPRHIRAVDAACCPDGSMIVEFHLATGIPLVHTGYLFKNYTETNNCIADNMRPEQRWHYLHHITGNWYKFSD